MESVDFVMTVLKYKKDAAEFMINTSESANNLLKERAKEIMARYIAANSEDEVNISSKVRAATENHIRGWESDSPFLSVLDVQVVLERDTAKRVNTFDAAFKEVIVMLYQNLWNKFRTEEAQLLCAADTGRYAGSRKSAYAVDDVR